MVPCKVHYERQLEWRMKQVELGRKSEAYMAFLSSVPRDARDRNHPRTPDAHDARMSKRQFEGRVKAWRRQINERFHLDISQPGSNKSSIPVYLFILPGEEQKLVHVKQSNSIRYIACELTGSDG